MAFEPVLRLIGQIAKMEILRIEGVLRVMCCGRSCGGGKGRYVVRDVEVCRRA